MTHETAIIITAIVHAGPPTLAVFTTYLLTRKEHKKMHTLLNGGMTERIEKAIIAALKKGTDAPES